MELKYVLDYMKYRKEMERQGKSSQANVRFLKGLIDKKTEDIIVAQKEEVTPLQKIKIKRQVRADLKKSISRVGLTLAAIGLAIGIGVKAGNVLKEGKYNRAEETNYEENSEGVQNFDESLKVGKNIIEEFKIYNEELRSIKQDAIEQVNDFENKDQVMEYLKKIYLEKYNSENHTSYTQKDIQMIKYGKSIFEREAENGDKIGRILEDTSLYSKNVGYIEVRNKDTNELLERGSILNGEYRNVYEEDEIVLADKDVNEMGKLLFRGLDYAIALDHKEQNSIEVMLTYKNRFENAIIEYKENEMNKVTHKEIVEADDNRMKERKRMNSEIKSDFSKNQKTCLLWKMKKT